MAAQRYMKARLAIGASVTAAVIAGSGYFYQSSDVVSGAESSTVPVATSNTAGTSASSASQAGSPSTARAQAPQTSTARRSRAS